MFGVEWVLDMPLEEGEPGSDFIATGRDTFGAWLLLLFADGKD